MFRQFGSGPDEISIFNASADFQAYAAAQGVDSLSKFKALPNEQQEQLLEDYNLSKGRLTQDELAKQGGPSTREQGTAPFRTTPTAAQAMMSCKTVNQCQKYDSDDIRHELERRGFTNGGSSKFVMEDGKKVEADFYERTTKPDLIKILLGHNKRLAKENRLQSKFESSMKGARGAFPSESTNPHMYDPKTGLLKEKFLTVDHHGLTAYNIKGDRYRVKWTPFGPNGGGVATWEKDEDQVPYGTQTLRGVYELDSRGLPKLSQLSYVDDLFKVHRDKKGNLWQVHVARKNKRSKSMAVTNAKKNRDGSPKLVWGKYDPTLNMDSKAGSDDKKKFVTPLGVYSYDQLMKMPLDNILKMMIVLELADESPKYAKKMADLGVGPFDRSAMTKGRLTGRQQVPMVKGKEKESSALNYEDKMLEEKAYKLSKFPECEYPQPPHRCYTDSYIPGTCVPDEKMCFNPKLRDPYKAYVQRKGYRADWAIQASEDASQYVTEDDIRAMYETASKKQAGPSAAAQFVQQTTGASGYVPASQRQAGQGRRRRSRSRSRN